MAAAQPYHSCELGYPTPNPLTLTLNQVAAALALLAREVGASLLCGVLVVASMLAANKQLAAATFRQQQALLRAAAERAQLVREMLGGIKVIKLQASELRFEERIQHARAAEGCAMMAHAAHTPHTRRTHAAHTPRTHTPHTRRTRAARTPHTHTRHTHAAHTSCVHQRTCTRVPGGPVSPLYPPCISPASPLHLPYIPRRQVAVTMRLVWLRAVLGALFACTPSLVAVAVLAAHTVRVRVRVRVRGWG